MAEKLTQKAVLDEISAMPLQKVKVAVSDIDGILRGKYLHKDKFISAAKNGFGFCSVVFGWDCNDVCYDNSQVSGWHNGYPDTTAKIDLLTYRKIPWEENVPFFLADFEDESGKPFHVCPRQLLKKVLKKASDMGFSTKAALEFEWFNFKESPESLMIKNYADPEPMSPGMFGYSVLRASQNQPFLTALMDDLNRFGVPLEGLHTETGPGVLEGAILYSDALEAADRGVLFKTAVKEIAHRFGLTATFMAKWHSKLPGCSGHMHQSLWDKNGETNQFSDPSDPAGMSQTFKHYVAGQMLLLPEVLPFYAPNVNSYKRLVEGYWAPTRATWGIDNRTTAFRVIKTSPSATRVETRISGSDINPYLTIAASIACGLYGIENKLALKDAPVKGNAYEQKEAVRLPRNLLEATEKLEQSKIAKEIFGKDFIGHFVNTRLWEWRQFQQSVTTYERERYFEII